MSEIIVTYRACGCVHFDIPRRDQKEEIARAAKGEVCPKCRASLPKPTGRGGAREGAGRPTLSNQKRERLVLYVTPDEREQLTAYLQSLRPSE
jgi:hypothetical protein